MPETPVSLLERLRDNPDAATWQRWLDLYTPILRLWLTRYHLQPHDAADVAQEVLLTVLREMAAFTHNRRAGAFRKWLRGILVNRLREFYRQRPAVRGAEAAEWGRTLDDLADPDSHLSRLWDREHDQMVLARMLELIEPEFEPATWQAFSRLVFGGEPAEVVAGQLGLTVNAVRIAKSRVLSRLRQESAGLVA